MTQMGGDGAAGLGGRGRMGGVGCVEWREGCESGVVFVRERESEGVCVCVCVCVCVQHAVHCAWIWCRHACGASMRVV